jgi:uncharacterized protein YukE
MAESEIYANPERLLSLADELRIFTNDLRIELQTMSDALHHLGATWQDEEYNKFKQAFSKLKEQLTSLSEEISKREPELKQDAQALRDFLAKTIP